MKKKGEVSVELLVTIVAFIIVLSIAILFLYKTGVILKGETNKEIIYSWVKSKGIAEKVDFTGDNIVDRLPPVVDLDEPLKVENEEDLLWHGNDPPKIYKKIADSMTDCWSAFDRGNTDFMNAVEKKTFCFPCRAIIFSEDIKKDRVKMEGFSRYINSERTRSTGTQTYFQYLNNDDDAVLENEDLQNDAIIADENLYVYFFAASGRGLMNILSTVALGESISEEETGSGYTPGLDSQPQYDTEGLTASERAEISAAAAGGVVLGRIAAENLAKNAVKAAAAKSIEKRFLVGVASKGARFVVKRIAWPITIVLSAYSVYEITFGEKPFLARIMIMEGNGVDKLCNQ